MKIASNIIKEHLKNVLFISGGAYGGKTTMAKLIEERYGIVRYREGDHIDAHIAYADEQHQPVMCSYRERSKFTYDDWNNYYNQEVHLEDAYRRLKAGSDEVAEMAIVDLIKLSQHQRVVADVMIPVETLKKIADYHQVVLLYAPVKMKRAHYYDREDKRYIIEHMMTMQNPEKVVQNCLDVLTYNGEEEIEAFKQSGFKCIERSETPNIETVLEEIATHFGLCRNGIVA